MQERPNTQYRIFRSAAVGDDQGGGIGAMTLPGTRIRGVIVDNPSGSWVILDGVGLAFQPYIAPYTLAWSVSLLPSVSELSARYVDGPTGQPSSTAGAPLVVYLFEAQVPSSAGSAFVVPAPTAESSVTSVTATPTVAGAPLLAGVSGRALRIYSVSCCQDMITGPNDSDAFVQLQDQSGVVDLGLIGVSREAPFAALPLVSPIDLPSGWGLFSYSRSAFGAVVLNVTTTYAYV